MWDFVCEPRFYIGLEWHFRVFCNIREVETRVVVVGGVVGHDWIPMAPSLLPDGRHRRTSDQPQER